MKFTRKVLILTLTFILLAMPFMNATAAEILLEDEAYESVCWEPLHRWDFDGDLEDSIGDAVARPVTHEYFTKPSYKGGKIILDGTQAYTFEEELLFVGEDNKKVDIRIDIKCKFDFNTFQGIHYIFGQNTDNKTSGLKFINLTGDTYQGCAMMLARSHTKTTSFTLLPDISAFDPDTENLYTFIAMDKTLYFYANGNLIASTEKASKSGQWRFTDFLGNSSLDIPYIENFIGEIDYIQISQYNEEYNSESFMNKLKANLDTIILVAIIAVVAIVVVIVVIIVVKKLKTKSKVS